VYHSSRLVIRHLRGTWGIYLAIAVGFTAAGLLLAYFGAGGQRWLGWVCIGVFGAGVPLFARRVADGRPRLEITDAGIHDRLLRVGVIEWSDIRDAVPYRVGSTVLVGLDVREPEKYLRRLPPIARRIATLHAQLGLPPLSLSLTGLAADPEHVIDLLRAELAVRATAGPTSLPRPTPEN
jgi:hypothetical protein